jgi:hypothetical protein
MPIAVGLNAFRIAMIGITVNRWGQKMADGFPHTFEGWSVFTLGLALLGAKRGCCCASAGRSIFTTTISPCPAARPMSSGRAGGHGPARLALALTALLAILFSTSVLV